MVIIMKKIFVAFVSLFFVPLFALEWGGLFTEDVKYIAPDIAQNCETLRQANNLILWANAPFTDSGSTYVAGQASVRYFTDIKQNDGFIPVYDVDLLKFSTNLYAGASVFSFSAGRFGVTDLTGKVFNQTSDGLSLKYTRPSMNFTAYAGYTGLLNAHNVTMLNKAEYLPSYNNGYYFAYKYLPISLSMEVPSLFLNQSFNAQILAVIDGETPSGDKSYSRYYGSLAFMGPIAGSVYYSLVSSFCSENLKNISNYSAFTLQYYFGSVLNIRANAEYASGNQLIFEPFRGVTSNTAYNSSEYPELSGLFMPSLDLVFTVMGVYLGINGKVVMGYPESDLVMKGINLSTNILVNIFSDLQLGLYGSYYYDMNIQGQENNFILNLNLSLSF